MLPLGLKEFLKTSKKLFNDSTPNNGQEMSFEEIIWFPLVNTRCIKNKYEIGNFAFGNFASSRVPYIL